MGRRSVCDLRLLGAILVICLPGCVGTTSTSYSRWFEAKANPGLSRWTQCIDDLSSNWWTRVYGLLPIGPAEATIPDGSPDQAFAAILAACDAHRRTPAWEAIAPESRRQMEGDARARFDDIGNQMAVTVEESII